MKRGSKVNDKGSLLIHSGTVVTATGSSHSDVLVRNGSIEAVAPGLHGAAEGVDRVIDAT